MEVSNAPPTEGLTLRTRLLPLATTLAAVVAVAGCSGGTAPSQPTYGGAPATSPSASPASPSETESEPTPEPEPEPEPVGTVIDISIKGGSVSPSGQRIKADLDEPVILKIRSDRAGEFHVHSTPEQVVAFKKGATTAKLRFEQAGVIDVEEHESGKVLVQLQVS